MHSVAIVVLEGVLMLDLAIPVQIFGTRSDTPYEVTLCGPSSHAVTAEGIPITLSGGLDAITATDTVIVAGRAPFDRRVDGEVVAALAAAHRQSRRMVSICTGAFALAEAGILDGRHCTTHWRCTDALAARYPRAIVEPNVLYVDDGLVLTSAGMCCGIDLCLHIVRSDLGADVANAVGRDLVVAPRREGGQAQYVQHLTGHADDLSLALTRAWALTRLHEPITVLEMARHAGCSERTFARRFIAETSVSPGRWLATARIDRARELLETADLSVDQVAHQCGLGTATNLRLHFRRALGTTPTAYRRAFSRRNEQRVVVAEVTG